MKKVNNPPKMLVVTTQEFTLEQYEGIKKFKLPLNLEFEEIVQASDDLKKLWEDFSKEGEYVVLNQYFKPLKKYILEGKFTYLFIQGDNVPTTYMVSWAISKGINCYAATLVDEPTESTLMDGTVKIVPFKHLGFKKYQMH